METTKHVIEIGQRSYDNKGVRKRPTIPFSRNVDVKDKLRRLSRKIQLFVNLKGNNFLKNHHYFQV